MMKLRIIPLIVVPCLLLFSGCSNNDPIEPEIKPSSTPAPVSLPEPEPECVHFWSSPDCSAPSFCLDCGVTGEILMDHVWIAANYQEAAKCKFCGETDGFPLEPNFISYGYRINTTSGRPYPYKTITNLDASINTTGTATLLYIDVFESDDSYIAMTGYEYIRARLMIIFDDDNAAKSGYKYIMGQIDFFGMDSEEIPVAFDDLPDSEIQGFKIAGSLLNYYGVDYEYFIKYELVQNEWIGKIAYIVRDFIYLVPAGYDGIVVYLSNAANWTDDESKTVSDIFDDDSLFFRLALQTN